MRNILPECDLISVLHRKAEARTDVTFDYVSQLRSLRERVNSEVRYINQLFPEFTPHDDEYHLSRLFHVADTLIERSRYEEMQATELFVLASGLYTHDWGMAVSEPERAYITTGTLVDGFTVVDFVLLLDENARFRRFLTERGVDPDQVRKEGASDDDWREYVRQTHALRSAERARRFFAPIDSGVAESVARVCEGHWLDFEKLQDYTRYPTAFSVLRESLNLAALAVYVRLVDLLDLASDRTPYVIWKFVAPRNPHSKMEWAKHRALQPVTCPPYQGGRIVRVDGSTDDHEVYAALEDLRIYCESQVRGCTDILARLNDSRHQLDLYHVEWKVAARGFDPVLVRFEFDRERVFEILSDEIYQGDAHVFLRELLQNSIDAIRTRRELLRRQGIAPQAFGLIRVEVEHGPDRNVRVAWSDNGVGMDAYIVRNYLAVAGKSFYRSDEFRRLGLEIDPISRFGIGILSCFMVAEEVEIETNKDPYARPLGDPLRVRIPAVARQFRVEKLSPGALEVGTRVTVHVLGARLPDRLERLEVTRYLKAVAGFVDFPILITESGHHTLILHPSAELNPTTDPRLQAFAALDIEVHRLQFGFPLEEAILPQDVENARAELVERSYDLQTDLSLTGVEGRITFLALRDRNTVIESTVGEHEGIELQTGDLGTKTSVRLTHLWETHWISRDRDVKWARSAEPHPQIVVYRNGILVADADVQDINAQFGDRIFPALRRVINLTASTAPEVDVSRTEMRSNDFSWYTPIQDAFLSKLEQELSDDLNSASGYTRLRHFAYFLASSHVPERSIGRPFKPNLPLPLFGKGGRVAVESWEKFSDRAVRVCPFPLSRYVMQLLKARSRHVKYIGFLTAWDGEDVVIAPKWYYDQDVTVYAAVRATRVVLETNYHLATVRFLTPPTGVQFPLVEETWEVGGPEHAPIPQLLARAIQEPLSLSARERAALAPEFDRYSEGVTFITFPETPTRIFRAGPIFNLDHPVGALLFRSLAFLRAERRSQRDTVAIGRLSDAISLIRNAAGPGTGAEEKLLEAAAQLGLHTDPESLRAPLTVWYSRYSPYDPDDERLLWEGKPPRRVAPFGTPF